MTTTVDVANTTVTHDGTSYKIQALADDNYTVLKDGVPLGRIVYTFGAANAVPEAGASEDTLYAIAEAWFAAIGE